MKRNLKLGLLLSALLTALSGLVHADRLVTDEVTLQMITTPLNTASMDDYLLDMARLTQINVIADATEFPAESSVVPYPSTSGAIAGLKGNEPENWRAALIIVMGDFKAQKRLSMLRADARTFLFWNEPDPRQLLQLQATLTDKIESARWAEAIELAQANGVPEDEIIRGQLSEEQLRDVLYGYLKNEQGWTETVANRNDHVNIQVRLDDLRPDLRALVLFDLRNILIKSKRFRLDGDQYWNTNRIRLSDGDPPALEATYQKPEEDGASKSVKYNLATLNAINEALTSAPVVSVKEPVVRPVQLGPKDTMFNAYSSFSNEIFDLSLDTDAALESLISLQVKRLPLRDLMLQLQQQSGVRLTLNEDAPADKLITARVEKMPLSKLMGVLSRTYGVKWDKTGDSIYQMRGNALGELHLKFLQLGDLELYRYRFLFYMPLDRDKERTAIGKAIIEEVGQEALRNPEGVPVSALSQGLQRRWRYFWDDGGADMDVLTLYKVNKMLTEQLAKGGLILRFGNAVSKDYRMPLRGFGMSEPQDFIRFNVQSEDGKVVLPVFNSFALQMAKPGEQDVRPRNRRR